MRKIKNWLLQYFVVFISCEKEKPAIPVGENDKTIIGSSRVDSVSYRDVRIKCSIEKFNDKEIVQHGFYWGISAEPTIEYNPVNMICLADTSSQCFINDLTYGTQYYTRPYFINGEYSIYGSEVIFTTTALSLPVLTICSISNIIADDAIEGVAVTEIGGSEISVRGVYWSISHQTISNDTTINGSGTEEFTSQLIDLVTDNTYYVREYATNETETLYSNQVSIHTVMLDFDGIEYGMVKIGNQIWMVENLRTTHYADGSPILLETGNTVWANSGNNDTNNAYCWYNNDYLTNGSIYGASSSPVNHSGVQGVCRDGWHLPSDAEWTELTDYLGGVSIAGDKMKEAGTSHWCAPNTGAIVESGFSALQGGSWGREGRFYQIVFTTRFWLTTEIRNEPVAETRGLDHDDSKVNLGWTFKNGGLCVRCIKD